MGDLDLMPTPCFFQAVSISDEATEIGTFPIINFVVGPSLLVKNGFLSRTDRACPQAYRKKKNP